MSDVTEGPTGRVQCCLSALKGRTPGLRDTKNNPLTSSDAWASRPDEDGGLDTSDQNCSCNCLGALVLLCSPWRPPKAEATRASRERWSWCCGDVPPLIRWNASWSFYTWTAYSETIFSPKERKMSLIVIVVNNQRLYKGNNTVIGFLLAHLTKLNSMDNSELAWSEYYKQ